MSILWVCSLLGLVLSVSAAPVPVRNDVTGLFTVSVLNDIKTDVKPTTVHCHGKNDDQPIRSLAPHEGFFFGFEVPVFPKPIYQCDYQWGAKKVINAVAFDSTNVSKYCLKTNACNFRVREGGIWSQNSDGLWRLLYPWN